MSPTSWLVLFVCTVQIPLTSSCNTGLQPTVSSYEIHSQPVANETFDITIHGANLCSTNDSLKVVVGNATEVPLNCTQAAGLGSEEVALFAGAITNQRIARVVFKFSAPTSLYSFLVCYTPGEETTIPSAQPIGVQPLAGLISLSSVAEGVSVTSFEISHQPVQGSTPYAVLVGRPVTVTVRGTLPASGDSIRIGNTNCTDPSEPFPFPDGTTSTKSIAITLASPTQDAVLCYVTTTTVVPIELEGELVQFSAVDGPIVSYWNITRVVPDVVQFPSPPLADALFQNFEILLPIPILLVGENLLQDPELLKITQDDCSGESVVASFAKITRLSSTSIVGQKQAVMYFYQSTSGSIILCYEQPDNSWYQIARLQSITGGVPVGTSYELKTTPIVQETIIFEIHGDNLQRVSYEGNNFDRVKIVRWNQDCELGDDVATTVSLTDTTTAPISRQVTVIVSQVETPRLKVCYESGRYAPFVELSPSAPDDENIFVVGHREICSYSLSSNLLSANRTFTFNFFGYHPTINLGNFIITYELAVGDSETDITDNFWQNVTLGDCSAFMCYVSFYTSQSFPGFLYINYEGSRLPREDHDDDYFRMTDSALVSHYIGPIRSIVPGQLLAVTVVGTALPQLGDQLGLALDCTDVVSTVSSSATDETPLGTKRMFILDTESLGTVGTPLQVCYQQSTSSAWEAVESDPPQDVVVAVTVQPDYWAGKGIPVAAILYEVTIYGFIGQNARLKIVDNQGQAPCAALDAIGGSTEVPLSTILGTSVHTAVLNFTDPFALPWAVCYVSDEVSSGTIVPGLSTEEALWQSRVIDGLNLSYSAASEWPVQQYNVFEIRIDAIQQLDTLQEAGASLKFVQPGGDCDVGVMFSNTNVLRTPTIFNTTHAVYNYTFIHSSTDPIVVCYSPYEGASYVEVLPHDAPLIVGATQDAVEQYTMQYWKVPTNPDELGAPFAVQLIFDAPPFPIPTTLAAVRVVRRQSCVSRCVVRSTPIAAVLYPVDMQSDTLQTDIQPTQNVDTAAHVCYDDGTNRGLIAVSQVENGTFTFRDVDGRTTTPTATESGSVSSTTTFTQTLDRNITDRGLDNVGVDTVGDDDDNDDNDGGSSIDIPTVTPDGTITKTATGTHPGFYECTACNGHGVCNVLDNGCRCLTGWEGNECTILIPNGDTLAPELVAVVIDPDTIDVRGIPQATFQVQLGINEQHSGVHSAAVELCHSIGPAKRLSHSVITDRDNTGGTITPTSTGTPTETPKVTATSLPTYTITQTITNTALVTSNDDTITFELISPLVFSVPFQIAVLGSSLPTAGDAVKLIRGTDDCATGDPLPGTVIAPLQNTLDANRRVASLTIPIDSGLQGVPLQACYNSNNGNGFTQLARSSAAADIDFAVQGSPVANSYTVQGVAVVHQSFDIEVIGANLFYGDRLKVVDASADCSACGFGGQREVTDGSGIVQGNSDGTTRVATLMLTQVTSTLKVCYYRGVGDWITLPATAATPELNVQPQSVITGYSIDGSFVANSDAVVSIVGNNLVDDAITQVRSSEGCEGSESIIGSGVNVVQFDTNHPNITLGEPLFVCYQPYTGAALQQLSPAFVSAPTLAVYSTGTIPTFEIATSPLPGTSFTIQVTSSTSFVLPQSDGTNERTLLGNATVAIIGSSSSETPCSSGTPVTAQQHFASDGSRYLQQFQFELPDPVPDTLVVCYYIDDQHPGIPLNSTTGATAFTVASGFNAEAVLPNAFFKNQPNVLPIVGSLPRLTLDNLKVYSPNCSGNVNSDVIVSMGLDDSWDRQLVVITSSAETEQIFALCHDDNNGTIRTLFALPLPPITFIEFPAIVGVSVSRDWVIPDQPAVITVEPATTLSDSLFPTMLLKVVVGDTDEACQLEAPAGHSNVGTLNVTDSGWVTTLQLTYIPPNTLSRRLTVCHNVFFDEDKPHLDASVGHNWRSLQTYINVANIPFACSYSITNNADDVVDITVNGYDFIPPLDLLNFYDDLYVVPEGRECVEDDVGSTEMATALDGQTQQFQKLTSESPTTFVVCFVVIINTTTKNVQQIPSVAVSTLPPVVVTSTTSPVSNKQRGFRPQGTSGSCVSDLIRCGEVCVDVSVHSQHCGQCDTACPASTLCRFSTCCTRTCSDTGCLLSCECDADDIDDQSCLPSVSLQTLTLEATLQSSDCSLSAVDTVKQNVVTLFSQVEAADIVVYAPLCAIPTSQITTIRMHNLTPQQASSVTATIVANPNAISNLIVHTNRTTTGCRIGELLCDSACVNVLSNNARCGGCLNQCSNRVCINGFCEELSDQTATPIPTPTPLPTVATIFTVVVPIVVASNTVGGDYQLCGVSLQDNAGNERVYAFSELQQSGLSPQVNVRSINDVCQGWWGPTCSIPCACSRNGECFDGQAGDGTCLSCSTGFWGADCGNVCTCSANGICNDGITGDGSCKSCNTNFQGTNCGSCVPFFEGATCTTPIASNRAVSFHAATPTTISFPQNHMFASDVIINGPGPVTFETAQRSQSIDFEGTTLIETETILSRGNFNFRGPSTFGGGLIDVTDQATLLVNGNMRFPSSTDITGLGTTSFTKSANVFIGDGLTCSTCNADVSIFTEFCNTANSVTLSPGSTLLIGEHGKASSECHSSTGNRWIVPSTSRVIVDTEDYTFRDISAVATDTNTTNSTVQCGQWIVRRGNQVLFDNSAINCPILLAGPSPGTAHQKHSVQQGRIVNVVIANTNVADIISSGIATINFDADRPIAITHNMSLVATSITSIDNCQAGVARSVVNVANTLITNGNLELKQKPSVIFSGTSVVNLFQSGTARASDAQQFRSVTDNFGRNASEQTATQVNLQYDPTAITAQVASPNIAPSSPPSSPPGPALPNREVDDVDLNTSLAWILGLIAGLTLCFGTLAILLVVFKRPPAAPADMPLFGDEPEHPVMVVPTEHEQDPFIPAQATPVQLAGKI